VLFDDAYYIQINEARWRAAEKMLDLLGRPGSCLDAGCGPGWFAQRLVARGWSVTGTDGRDDLLDVARNRVPAAKFLALNIEAASETRSLPVVDLVFCFGLLYHLENPFAAIRNLHRCTGKHMLIETQLAPEVSPTFHLVSEGENETQGLTFHAVIPSRSALVKMLHVAGFASVQRYAGAVEHEDFVETPGRKRRRDIFLAGTEPVKHPDFIDEPEPRTPKIDYSR
jgi:SAM-dependent methyltransferase